MGNRDVLLKSLEAGNFLETVHACSLANHNDISVLALDLATLHDEGLIDSVETYKNLKNGSSNGPEFFRTLHVFEEALPQLAASISSVMRRVWAAILNDEETYNKIGQLKRNHLQHCNFQFWYPDELSEAHFYTNDNSHGAVLSNVCVDRPKEEFLAQVFGECDQSPHFKELSAIKFNWWPLIVVACRHYRQPLPVHLLGMLHVKL